jgi:hypothetical protein
MAITYLRGYSTQNGNNITVDSTDADCIVHINYCCSAYNLANATFDGVNNGARWSPNTGGIKYFNCDVWIAPPKGSGKTLTCGTGNPGTYTTDGWVFVLRGVKQKIPTDLQSYLASASGPFTLTAVKPITGYVCSAGKNGRDGFGVVDSQTTYANISWRPELTKISGKNGSAGRTVTYDYDSSGDSNHILALFLDQFRSGGGVMTYCKEWVKKYNDLMKQGAVDLSKQPLLQI